jgi:hypothetical protein
MAAERGEKSDPLRLTNADFEDAVRELVEFGGAITQHLLGYRNHATGTRTATSASGRSETGPASTSYDQSPKGGPAVRVHSFGPVAVSQCERRQSRLSVTFSGIRCRP